MNADIKNLLVNQNISIVEAMEKIDKNSGKALYVVDEDNKLLGCVTDGDIRRWVIKTGDLTAKAAHFMHCDVKYLSEVNRDGASDLIKSNLITSIPIVDDKHRVVDICFQNQNLKNYAGDKHILDKNAVIIMAGGKGTRLYPFTKILPKPLIPIGEIPIVERIINRFKDFGASNFYLTVNYKKDMIISYFNEISRDYDIHYVEENKPLGTAGSIKLIKDRFDEPVVVTNCDTLIDVDYESLMSYHNYSKNDLTIVAALKSITIPYGVLHSKEDGIVKSMEEKPKLSYFINTGLYIVNPEFLQLIPDDTFYHMPQLADDMMKKGLKVGMYPISEEGFLDMGEFEEMQRMEKKLGLS